MKYRDFRMKYSMINPCRIKTIHSSVVKVMQEKIDFFKSNSGLNSIDYNTISGQLTILNGKLEDIYVRERIRNLICLKNLE